VYVSWISNAPDCLHTVYCCLIKCKHIVINKS
jgi:hypothetical protein